MSKYKYCPWPLGALPKEFQRPEPEKLRELGYQWDDPRDIVDIFERKVADYWGAKYAVSVDCCSHAIFLSLMYSRRGNLIQKGSKITIPKHTYVSVPMQIIHAGMKVKFKDIKWMGYYELFPTRVIDAAVMWEEGGYIPNTLMCLSFQIKKAIPTGKGGIILTDDEYAAKTLRLMAYDGRDLTTPYDSEDHVRVLGYHMYMTPEDAARSIILMDQVGDMGSYMGSENYPDVSEMLKNII